jgi:hypothetical protein
MAQSKPIAAFSRATPAKAAPKKAFVPDTAL